VKDEPNPSPAAEAAVAEMRSAKDLAPAAELPVAPPPPVSRTRILDLPENERPRERVAAHGAENVRNTELIAILLRTGMRGRSAVAMAEDLLARFRTLENLARAPLDELRKVKGIGRDKAVTLLSAFHLARRMAAELAHEQPLMDTPARIAALLREDARFLEVEQLHVVLLNTRRRLIRIERVSQGTIDSTIAHPRDVFRAAIAANAASVVLAHNHPSGDPTPSEADIRTTREMIRAGDLMKITVVDHIILGRATIERPRDFVSMRELGYFHT
jgi:DNA repair protein RadC